MTKLKNILCVLCALALVFRANAQYKIEALDSNTFTLGEGVVLHKTSFRGLSVVDDLTIWVSGSRGTIAKSKDGGKTFSYTQLKGYEKSDFRDIEAFDDKRAIIMSSGTPAYILKTTDGGQTWKEVYKNTDTAYFLDAMDFWDEKRGMLVGDPINGHFVLLQTNDGGETWQELDTTKTPKAMEGEAVFAASGTSLRCWGKDDFAFVTGGIISRLFEFRKMKITTYSIPIIQGLNSQGCFSFTSYDNYFNCVGGDYLIPNKKTISYSVRRVKYEVGSSLDSLSGYMSCVEKITPNCVEITTGTNGSDRNQCGLIYPISSEPFHVVRKAKKGKTVFLAGPNGKIGKLIY